MSRRRLSNWPRNQMLEFFANSFIVLAGRDTIQRASFDQLGVIYSSRRRSELSTQTRIVEAPSGQWIVSKRIRSARARSTIERLRLVGTESSWIDSRSLQTTVDLRARSTGASLTTIFEPCTRWIALLEQSSTTVDGVCWLPRRRSCRRLSLPNGGMWSMANASLSTRSGSGTTASA